MFHRRPFYACRCSLACVIGIHLPMSGVLGVVIMLQVTSHAGGVPKATLERGRSVEFPSEGNHSLMRIVKQNRFRNLGELHKEWTEAGVKASRALTHRRVKELATVVVRGVLPELRRRRSGLLPSGPKSSFQMRASFVFHLETKVIESGGRVEKLIAQVAF